MQQPMYNYPPGYVQPAPPPMQVIQQPAPPPMQVIQQAAPPPMQVIQQAAPPPMQVIQQAAPAPAAQPIIVNVKSAPSDNIPVVRGIGSCPICQRGQIEPRFTWYGMLIAVAFFPAGILCCLFLRKRSCNTCGYSL